jgi:hypothetical protein
MNLPAKMRSLVIWWSVSGVLLVASIAFALR